MTPIADSNSTLDRDHLESLIDRHGVALTLVMIAEICADKAEHIEENWQDTLEAKTWRKVGKRVDQCSQTVDKILPAI